MNIAILTARGGSKRIPNKNFREFNGKPMLAWPILAAQRAGIFDEIIISTDSDQIAAVAEEYGVKAPFRRPAELADDHCPTAPVVLHALQWLQENGRTPARVCCLYPTAPFIRAADLRRGLDLLLQGCPAVVPVTTFAFPVWRALKLSERNDLEFNWPEYQNTRSQDLPELYHDAGQFYWAAVQDFLREKSFLMPGAKALALPRMRVQDLDTPEDWERAELMARALRGELA